MISYSVRISDNQTNQTVFEPVALPKSAEWVLYIEIYLVLPSEGGHCDVCIGNIATKDSHRYWAQMM